VEINAALAQVPVTRDIEANVQVALDVVRENRSADLIVFPEGLLSGYAGDLSWLAQADAGAIEAALGAIATAVDESGTSVWVGSLVHSEGRWWNAAVGLAPSGLQFRYDKVNLASCERGRVEAGNALPVYDFPVGGQPVRVGVQICREVRHPEQWRALAASGAELFVHLNNAFAEDTPSDVWRSLLVSRAVENQRFVLSTNAAGHFQRVPTLAVAPDGEVLASCAPDEPALLHVAIDLADASNTYLDQVRRDLVSIEPLP
jgi:predicted amidohydrolase